MDKSQVDYIAKMLTEDPDIFNEGWEELGIADPGLEAGLNSRELIEKVKEFFNIQYPDIEYNFIPNKKVDVETFLAGRYPFTMFMPETAMDGMPDRRAANFFPTILRVLSDAGWKLPDSTVAHDKERGRFMFIMIPSEFSAR
jgi:hypothetical protein